MESQYGDLTPEDRVEARIRQGWPGGRAAGQLVCFQFRRDATIRRRRCILMHLDAPWRPSFPA